MGEDDLKSLERSMLRSVYVYTEEWVAVIVHRFDSARRGNYFGLEQVRRTKVEVRVKKLNTDKAVSQDEVMG